MEGKSDEVSQEIQDCIARRIDRYRRVREFDGLRVRGGRRARRRSRRALALTHAVSANRPQCRSKTAFIVEAPNTEGNKVRGKVLAMVGLLVGLSACHAGFGIGDNDRGPTHVAGNAWESAVAQSSIGTVSTVAWTAD